MLEEAGVLAGPQSDSLGGRSFGESESPGSNKGVGLKSCCSMNSGHHSNSQEGPSVHRCRRLTSQEVCHLPPQGQTPKMLGSEAVVEGHVLWDFTKMTSPESSDPQRQMAESWRHGMGWLVGLGLYGKMSVLWMDGGRGCAGVWLHDAANLKVVKMEAVEMAQLARHLWGKPEDQNLVLQKPCQAGHGNTHLTSTASMPGWKLKAEFLEAYRPACLVY